MLLSTNDGTTLLGANCDRTYYDDVGGWDIALPRRRPADGRHDGRLGAFRRCAASRPSTTSSTTLERLPVVVAARLGRIVDVYGLRLARRPRRRRGEGRVGGVGRHRLLVGAGRRRRRRLAGARPATTVTRRSALVAGRAPSWRCSSRPSSSTAPTASGPRPSRRSSCSPPPASRLVGRSTPIAAHSRRDRDARRQGRRARRERAAPSSGARSWWRSAAAPTRRSSPPSPRATLGADGAHAVTAVSPSLAGAERDDCAALADEWGLRWTAVETDEMARAAYRTNDIDRCFHCKAELMDVLAPIAAADGRTDRARRQRRRPRRPPPGPAGGDRGRRRVPAGDRRVHQGRRPRGVAPRSACARGTSRRRRAWPAASPTGRR